MTTLLRRASFLGPSGLARMINLRAGVGVSDVGWESGIESEWGERRGGGENGHRMWGLVGGGITRNLVVYARYQLYER